jgi:uncharacterized protein (DUF736 family)
MENKIFAIFKNKDKKNEKSPDYNISFKVNGKYTNIGGCWLKEGKQDKYFSCKLSNGYKTIKGFHIEQDPSLTPEEIERIQEAREGETVDKTNISSSEIPF